MLAAVLISDTQRRAIFGYVRELGIKLDREHKNDALYDLVERETGKRAVSKLTNTEADRVLYCLKGMLSSPPPPSEDRWKMYAFGLNERNCMASLKQLEFIRALIIELARLDPSSATKDKRLRGWLEKYHHTSDIRFLKSYTASKVIDGLKTYLTKLGWRYHPKN